MKIAKATANGVLSIATLLIAGEHIKAEGFSSNPKENTRRVHIEANKLEEKILNENYYEKITPWLEAREKPSYEETCKFFKETWNL